MQSNNKTFIRYKCNFNTIKNSEYYQIYDNTIDNLEPKYISKCGTIRTIKHYQIDDNTIDNLEPKYIMDFGGFLESQENFLEKISPYQIEFLSNQSLIDQCNKITIRQIIGSKWFKVMTKERMTILACSRFVKVFNELAKHAVIRRLKFGNEFFNIAMTSMPTKPPRIQKILEDFLADDKKQNFLEALKQPDVRKLAERTLRALNFFRKIINRCIKQWGIEYECTNRDASKIFDFLYNVLINKTRHKDKIRGYIEVLNINENCEFKTIIENIGKKLFDKYNDEKMSTTIRSKDQLDCYLLDYGRYESKDLTYNEFLSKYTDVSKFSKQLFKVMKKEVIADILFDVFKNFCKNDPMYSGKFITAFLNSCEAELEITESELKEIQNCFDKNWFTSVKEIVKRISEKIFDKHHDNTTQDMYIKVSSIDCLCSIEGFNIHDVHPDDLDVLGNMLTDYLNIECKTKRDLDRRSHMENIKQQLDEHNKNIQPSFQNLIKGESKFGSPQKDKQF